MDIHSSLSMINLINSMEKTNNIEKVAKLIAKLTGTKIKYIEMPENLKGQYQEYTCADITKLNEYISIENFIGIEEYLKDTLIQK